MLAIIKGHDNFSRNNWANNDLLIGNIKVDPDQPLKSPGIRLCAEIINYASANPRSNAKLSCKIDAIPSLEFDRWPKKGRAHKPSYLPTKTWNEARSCYHVIPKCHYSG